MAMPSVLQDMNCFLHDESYAGLCNKMTLPDIVVKTVDVTQAGVAGDIELSSGKLDKLNSTLTISDYSAKVLGFIGSRTSAEDVFNVRGALGVGGNIKTIVVRLAGLWKSAKFNEWSGEGVEVTNEFEIAIDFFEFEIDGKVLVKIDKQNNIFETNGIDHNKAIREALAQ